MSAGSRPVYDWDRARPGDRLDPVTKRIDPAKIAQYVEVEDDRNPHFRPGASAPSGVPLPLVRVYAPLLRRELVAAQDCEYPAFTTPAVDWGLELFKSPKSGDVVHSVTSLADKFVRRDRRYVEWHVDAWLDGGEPLLKLSYVNLWEPGRAEDRTR